jgi:hypothetical protein
MERKSSGDWVGEVSDRMKCKIGEYSVGGKKEISYMKWLRKKGISREMSEREASSRGLSIPLEHFVERGGGKKECVVKEKKKRGRPRKEKSVSSKNEGEEVVESALEEVEEEGVKEVEEEGVKEEVEEGVKEVEEEGVKEVEEEGVKEVEEEGVKEAVEVVKEKKKRGRPRKEKSVSSKNEGEEVVESALEEVEEEGVKEAVEPVKEKKKRGRPRKEKSVSSNNEGEELIASLLKERKESELGEVVNEASSDGEEETLVIKIEIDGKTYLKSEDNTVFDFMSHDELGIWNEKENKIVLGVP